MYRVTPNPSTPACSSSVELTFSKRVKLVIEKFLTDQKKKKREKMPGIARFFKVGEKVIMRVYKNGKQI